MIDKGLEDRVRGALLGLATGDALGTTLEFKRPGQFRPIDDMVGGGPFNLAAGCWTDDTSMALCLADSLLACDGFDAVDQMRRYVRWWQQGYRSSIGRCFDIGNTVSDALNRFLASGVAFCGSRNPRSAGNGSLMRLAPIPIFYRADPVEAVARAADSSRTTHGAETCVDACRYYTALMVAALNGAGKDELLSKHYAPAGWDWGEAPLVAEIAAIAAGSYKTRNPPEIRGTGYVVETMEAALWAFMHSTDFRSGALLAVNLGDDADTTGAIYGQLAGAFYGASGIPRDWLDRLAQVDELTMLADALAGVRR